MSSVSSAGVSLITLQFALHLNMDAAEQQVQAAMNAPPSLLPADLPAPPVYAKVNPADAPIMQLAVTSDSLPLPEVQNMVQPRLALKISQIGRGLVTLAGGQRPRCGCRATCRRSPPQPGAGRLAAPSALATQRPRQLRRPDAPVHINANDQLTARRPRADHRLRGAPVRLKDVAQVVDGARTAAWAPGSVSKTIWLALGRQGGPEPEIVRIRAAAGSPPSSLNVQRQPGANVIATVDAIRASCRRCGQSLPATCALICVERPHGGHPRLGRARGSTRLAGWCWRW